MATVDIKPLSPSGLGADALTAAQRDLLLKLLDVYIGKMASDIAEERLARLRKAGVEKIGFAWAGGMNNDRVVRINTKTGEVTEYLLPRMTNIRRVNVDNGRNPPAFWVGNNLGASLVRVEPLE